MREPSHEVRRPRLVATPVSGERRRLWPGVQEIWAPVAQAFGSLPTGAVLSRVDGLVGGRPRYLVHGSILVVGAAVLGVLAAQPRAAGPTLADRPAAIVQPTLEVARDLAAAEPLPPAVPTAAVQPTPAPPAPTAEPAPTKPQVHVVEAGESLRQIADKYGIGIETILVANKLDNPDLLKVGQELVILPTDGVLYTVKSGDTLGKIAARYEVEPAAILEANDLGDNPDIVVVGTNLVIPGAAPALETARSDGDEGGEQREATIGGGIPLVPTGNPETAAQRAVPSSRTYEVQPGDTLRGIATTFGVDVATILSSNGFDDPDLIKPGVELRILPVKGIEYEVEPGETLADVAYKYQVDLGLLLDYNDLSDPDVIRVGTKLVVPGGQLRADLTPAPEAPSAPAVAAPVVTAPVVTAPGPAGAVAVPAPAPAAPRAVAKPEPKPAPPPAPVAEVGSGGGTIVANAMKYRGYPYVFGGTSPSGFDCSGFVYYIHRVSGSPVGRGMWQQFNGGPRIAMSDLVPGDTVFFANTYMPGLSHNGIYIGNGQFVHASDPSTGVVVSSMHSAYWSSRYAGAARLWN